jgi:hypothetical protein
MAQRENEYVKQAREFLERNRIEFRAVLIGNDCPSFCEDARKQIDMDKVDTFPRGTHIHGKHYRCTFSAKERGHFAVDFWNSYADSEENFFAFGNDNSLGNWVTGRDNCYWDKYRINGKYPGRPRIKQPIKPTAYDVLASITKDDPGTFEQFCGDFGYDEDSRRAEDVYRAVVEEWKRVRRFFTDAELTEVREIQ